jgi:hypothetical protein
VTGAEPPGGGAARGGQGHSVPPLGPKPRHICTRAPPHRPPPLHAGVQGHPGGAAEAGGRRKRDPAAVCRQDHHHHARPQVLAGHRQLGPAGHAGHSRGGQPGSGSRQQPACALHGPLHGTAAAHKPLSTQRRALHCHCHSGVSAGHIMPHLQRPPSSPLQCHALAPAQPPAPLTPSPHPSPGRCSTA